MCPHLHAVLLLFWVDAALLEGNKLEETPPVIIDHPSDLVVKKDQPATLNCRAAGVPEPTIEWYRNGEYVETSKDDVHPQRSLLPGGSLFFYRLKGKSDEGVYTCLARNRLGATWSRNASLYIAALREDFRLSPVDTVVAVGNPLVVDCLPPKGYPEPTVTWKKDGVAINLNSSRYTVAAGKLTIGHVLKADSGAYVCVAFNQAGQRESRGAQITVLGEAEKPLITKKPEDTVARLGDPVQFVCGTQGARGVRWRKEQGELPQGRFEITAENTLWIQQVTVHDSGTYTCVAENMAGSVSAKVSLAVQDPLDTGQTDRQKEIYGDPVNVRVHLDNVTALPSSSVYVHWKVLTPSPLAEGYSVFYRLHLPIESDWTEWTLPRGTQSSTVIPSLRRGQRYEIKVRPFVGKIYGASSNIKRLRIPGEALDVAPQNINVTAAEGGNGSVIVSWEPPPASAHAGEIKGYKVWCFGNETYQSDWFVDKEARSLVIPTLVPGVRYHVQVAAINDAGIGTPSGPKYVFIEAPEVTREKAKELTSVDVLLRVIRHPAFIATAGGVTWVVLMMAAIYVCQRHSKRYSTKKHSVWGNGLYRFASEDTIIKHRMDTSDSPWLSNTWKSTSCSRNYSSTTSVNSHLLWTDAKDASDFHKSTMSFERRSEGSRSQIIPLGPDGAGLYGALCGDLPGRDLTTFQRAQLVKQVGPAPHSRAPVPLGLFDQTALPQYFNVVTNYSGARSRQTEKPVLPVSPNILQNLKKELHHANSAPLSPFCQKTTQSSGAASVERLQINQSGKGEYAKVMKTFSSPKVLQYTTSLKVMDLLPFTSLPPPPMPPPQNDPSCGPLDDKGCSYSVAKPENQQKQNMSNKRTPPNRLNVNRISAASLPLSMNGDSVLTPDDVAKYLELGEGDTTGLDSECESISSARTYGYICSPLPSHRLDEDDDLEIDDINSLKSYRKYCETPTSSISEYESSMAGSLVNGWGSVSEDNYTSARCSMISSSDASFLMEANFAKALAVAVDSFCSGLPQVEAGGAETGYTDFPSSASPLDGILSGHNHSDRADITKMRANPLPVLDWNIDWMDEMEAKYSRRTEAKRFPFNKKMDPFNELSE